MDLEYDAFDEGIEPGGLRSRNEIKVLVCYLLKSIEQPISKQLINEILQENSLANYFEINQAVSDLVRAGQSGGSGAGRRYGLSRDGPRPFRRADAGGKPPPLCAGKGGERCNPAADPCEARARKTGLTLKNLKMGIMLLLRSMIPQMSF